MATRRSKNLELIKGVVYPCQKDEDNIYYLLYKDENQKYKPDQQVKFYELSSILEEKEHFFFVPDEKPTNYTLKDVLYQIVETQQVSKNIKGKKYECIKISDIERLRIEKIFQQIEESKIEKKDPEATQKDLIKQRALEKAEEKQKQKEEEEAEKKKLEEERLKKNPNFKIGHHNKNIKKIPEKIEQFEGNSKEFDYSCCPTCANKELLRAVIIGDTELFQKILSSEEKITTLGVVKSFDDSISILEAIFKNNDLEMLKILIDFLQNKKNKLKLAQHHYSVRNGNYSAYQQKFNSNIWGWNPSFPQKEQNNALIYDKNLNPELFNAHFFMRLFKYEVDAEMWNYLRIYTEESLDDQINHKLGVAVQLGNRKLAAQLIEFINTKRSGWGYNQLHLETLTKERAEDVYDFKTQSIIKTPLSEVKVTPLHCACINPNPDILKRILTQQDQSQFVDEQQKKLTHYAAACSGPGPLKYLVQEKGLNPLEVEHYHGFNSLHIACFLGRAKNVEFLLSDKSYFIFEQANYQQEYPIHLAAKSGDLNTVKALLENGCPIDTQGPNQQNALHLAASLGYLDIVEYLLKKQKKLINEVDQQGKSALTHAVLNNQTPVVAYLLQQGADYDLADLSGNSPIHYAAAYGYSESIELLYVAGCDLNFYNDWSTTPLCIALIKGHNKTVKQLLNYDQIDVNCVDDQGQTLLYLETTNFLNSEKLPTKYFQKFEFLLEKNADPNLPNKHGQTPLHILVSETEIYPKIKAWALQDPQHPQNPKNAFFTALRKELSLKDSEIIPQNIPKYKIYYKQASESQFVRENLEHVKKSEKNPILLENYKNEFIEIERSRLENEKIKELHEICLEKSVLKLIKLFQENKADITLLDSGLNYQKHNQSPLSLAIQNLYDEKLYNNNNQNQFNQSISANNNLDIQVNIFQETLTFSNFKILESLLQNVNGKIQTEDAFQQGCPYYFLMKIFSFQTKNYKKQFEILENFLKIDKDPKITLNQVIQNGSNIYNVIFTYFKVFSIQEPNLQEQKFLYNKKNYEQNNAAYQQRINDFYQLIDLLVQYGFDPKIRNQRFLKKQKNKGPYLNRTEDDKDLDLLQEQENSKNKQNQNDEQGKMEEEEEEEQEDSNQDKEQIEDEDEDEDEQEKFELEKQQKLEIEKKEREQQIQKNYKSYNKVLNDFGQNGEQNFYSILVTTRRYDQEVQYQMMKYMLEKYDVDVNHRSISDLTPLHLYLKYNATILIKLLKFFIQNTKYSHQFRYTDLLNGNNILHSMFEQVYLPNQDQIKQYKMDDPTLSDIEAHDKYYKEFNSLIFSISNIEKCFEVKNNAGKTPIMILISQSQNQYFKQQQSFKQIIQNPQIIKSIQETQSDKTTCLHHLFASGIHTIDNLIEMLRNGGHKLLNVQRSFILLKGRKPNKKEIQRADLANPLHYLINTGNLTKEVLTQILNYPEGKKSILQKDIKQQLPMHALVQCGYAPSLLKDLLVPAEINSNYFNSTLKKQLGKRKKQEVEQSTQLLRQFITIYPENERTVAALKNLLLNGADVNYKNPEDYQERDNFFLALMLLKFQFVAAMVENGYDINSFFYTYKTVKYQVNKEDFYLIKREICQEYNPLHFAIKQNNEQIVKRFLELGADPNKTNYQGKTALIVACEKHKNTQILNLLLAHKAEISQDNFKKNPLQYTFLSPEQILNLPENTLHYPKNLQKIRDSALISNENFGLQSRTLDELVVQAQIQYQQFQQRKYYQSQSQNEDPTLVFNMLIKNNEKYINQQDEHGKSLIHYMALSNGAMALRFLIKNHKESSNLDLKDNYLNTPLSLAMLNKNQEVAKILIEAGANTALPAYVHRDDPTTSKYQKAPQKLFDEEDWSDIEDEEDLDIRKEKEKFRQKLIEDDLTRQYQEINIFQLAILNGWQAICSLLNEYNFDLQMACESAFRSSNFQLARNLLFKQEKGALENLKLNQNGQNLLHIFAETGNSAGNKRLIKKLYQEIVSKNENANLQDNQGKTPLILAAEHNFIYLAKHLLKDLQVDTNIQDTHQKSALHHSIQQNHPQITEKILQNDKKPEPSLQDDKGNSVLHLFPKSYLSKNASQKLVFNFQLTPELLKKFPQQKDRERYQAKLQEDFFSAQQNKSQKTESQLQFLQFLALCQQNQDLNLNNKIINLENKKAETPLYKAVKHRNVFAVKTLVDEKADFNVQISVKSKNSALMLAATMPDQDFFQFFLRSGLEINWNLKNQNQSNILHLAALHNQTSIFEKLPNNFPVDDQNEFGNTPLLLAFKQNNTQIYRKLLLNFKANPSLSNKENYLPLHYAAINNDFYGIQLLLQHNAKTQLINSNFNSPIGEALIKKHYLAAAKLIMSKQFDISKEYVTSYTIKRKEFLTEEDKVNAEEKYELQQNYQGQTLTKERKFIFDIETKREIIKGKKREVYYVKTATVTPLLLFLVKQNIIENTHYLFKKEKTPEFSLISQKEKQILEESGNLIIDQNEFIPEISEPKAENLLSEILKAGQSPYQQNHEGKFLLITAITHNETFIVKSMLEQIQDFSQFENLEHGYNPIHYCIEPLEYGSFQNLTILKALIDKGFDINKKTDKGFTPLDMALLQDHNKLAKVLEENGAQKNKTKLNIQRGGTSIIKEQQWNQQQFNADEDSVKYLDYLIEKHRITPKEHSQPLPEAKNACQLYQNDETDLIQDKFGAFDCLLTKVDPKIGQWGVNIYHRMQLLYSQNTRRYFVLEKWGEIGQSGYSKSSPFQHKIEAVKEFENVFNEKTGNNWKKRFNYEKQPKKYNYHTPIERLDIDKYIKPFDFKGLEEGTVYGKQKISSKLPSKVILNIMKEIINFRKIQTQYTNLNIEQDLFNLDPEILEEAQQILTQIQENVEELQDQMANLLEADVEKILEIKEQIGELTNDYYSIIPEKVHFTQTQPFIDNYSLIQQKKSIIHKLQNLETTTKIIAGAHCQLHYKNIHPADYTFQCLQIRLKSIENTHVEYKLVQRYIQQTNKNVKLSNIFALERKGEAEAMEGYKHLENRQLLFHPTNQTSLLAAMAEGIKPSLEKGGDDEEFAFMFGNGIYFTDSFQNSLQYINNNSWQQLKVKKSIEEQREQNILKLKQRQQNLRNNNINIYQNGEDEESDSSELKSDSYNSDDEESLANDSDYDPKIKENEENKNYKYVFLCEVALGEQQIYRKYTQLEGLEQNFQSVKGEGKNQPNDKNTIVLANGVKVPCGNMTRGDKKAYQEFLQEKQKMNPNSQQYKDFKFEPFLLNYNHHVVFNHTQVRIRYLVQFEEEQK